MHSIDVIIPMYNGVQTIVRTVEALIAQELKPSWTRAIIVVDDASTDGSVELLERRYGREIEIVRLRENLGRGGARNAGAKYGTSEYLMFIDCDCVMEGTRGLLGLAQQLEKGCDVCFGQARGHGKGFWAAYLQRVADNREQLARIGDCTALTSANFIVRRAVFEEIGGFDERYREYGFEDRDLVARLENKSAKICFRPDATVWHEDKLSIESVCRKLEEAGRFTSSIFAADHPETYAKMSYSHVDARLHPWRVGLLRWFTVPLLPMFIKLGERTIGSRVMPQNVKTHMVKILSGLAYLKGTYLADRSFSKRS